MLRSFLPFALPLTPTGRFTLQLTMGVKLWIALCTAGALFAQTEFDVVSIVPHPILPTYKIEGDSYQGDGVTLVDMIEVAYEIAADHISGSQAWVSADHFDVEARVSTPKAGDQNSSGVEQGRRLLRAMLAQRFKLQVRRENREVDVYNLLAAGSGLKVQRSAQGTIGITADQYSGHVEATGATMAQLAEKLSFSRDRPVLDKTGLAGNFSFTLDWAQDDRSHAPDSSVLSEALEQQLGLKLESSRTVQEFLVIESAEKPAP